MARIKLVISQKIYFVFINDIKLCSFDELFSILLLRSGDYKKGARGTIALESLLVVTPIITMLKLNS